MPERGYPLLEVPEGAVPATSDRRPAPAARPTCAAPCGPPRTPSSSTGAEVVVGFGGYVSTPAYLAARRRGTPIVVHEQNARPGLANRLGARLRRRRRRHVPRHAACRTPPLTGMPLRREIATLDRAAQPGRGAGAVRARPTPPPCSSPAGRSAPSGSTTRSPGPPRRCRRAGVQVLHVAGTGKGFVARRRDRRALRRARVLRPDGPRLRRRRPRRRALRRQHGVRAHRRRAARRSTCRCRSATASSGSTPPPSSTPVAGCSSTTTTSPPAWVGDVVRPLALDAGPAGRRWPPPPRRWGSAVATSCSPTSSSRPREVAGA